MTSHADGAVAVVVRREERTRLVDRRGNAYDAEGYLPAGVLEYEKNKVERYEEAFARDGIAFVPAIVSHHGVLGDRLRKFVRLLAEWGAAHPSVQEYFMTGSVAAAAGRFEQLLLNYLAVALARVKGRRIAAFYQAAGGEHGRPGMQEHAEATEVEEAAGGDDAACGPGGLVQWLATIRERFEDGGAHHRQPALTQARGRQLGMLWPQGCVDDTHIVTQRGQGPRSRSRPS